MNRHLFDRLPRAARAIPWIPLADLPTPITEVEIPGGRDRVRVHIKRDDLSGTPYGGNKVRKLEFLLGEARQRGATRVITAGAFGSHHALATTVYARRAGMDATLVLFPQHVTPHVRQIVLACASLGAEIRFTGRMESVPFALWRAAQDAGAHAVVIPPGGSNAAGTLGYVEAGLELAAQWGAGISPRPRRIHLAAGTLGTTAGLAIGLAMAGENIEVAAARITSRIVTNERALLNLIKGALGILEPYATTRLPVADRVMAGITLMHDQVGDGYGRETQAGADALARFADAGIELDATYTAKSAAALLQDPLTAAGETLYLHTLSAVAPVASLDLVSVDALPQPIAERVSRTMEF